MNGHRPFNLGGGNGSKCPHTRPCSGWIRTSARGGERDIPGVSNRAKVSCVRQVQQIDLVERVLVGFQVNSSIPLFDRK